jgi:acetyl esterase/lipase
MIRYVRSLLLPLLLGACSPLAAFNGLVPKDPGVRRVADLPFGAHARQKLDVYAPDGARELPVLVFIYGGSWESGTKNGYQFAGKAFAAQGFVTVIPDYRLMPEVVFPGFLEDNAAAVRWARANATAYGGDPDRVVIAGHSAGAYNAAMLALDPQWLGPDRAAVRGFVGLAGPYDFLPLRWAVTKAAFGQAADLNATQPINFPSAGDPPALLAHGGVDRTVYPRNSETLAAKLRAAGVPVELRLYPNVGHAGIVTALARPFRRQAPVLADVAAFAKKVTAEPAAAAR